MLTTGDKLKTNVRSNVIHNETTVKLLDKTVDNKNLFSVTY